jgi:ATP-binding cassette subfamily B protein
MHKPIKEKIQQAIRIDRAIRLAWQAAPGSTAAGIALQIVQGVLPLAALFLVKLIVDAVTYSLAAPDKSQAFTQVVLLILLAGFIALLIALCQLLANMVNESLSLTVTDHVYDVLHAKSVEVDLEYYENPRYFDTLHRAQQEGPYRPSSVVNNLVQFIQNSVSLVAMAVLLYTLHWSIAFILFAAALPGLLVRINFANKMFDWHKKRTETERQAMYINWVLTGDIHAKEIRLFGLGDLLISGATVAVFGSLAFIAYKTVHGNITLGDMVMFFQAFQRGLGAMRNLLGSMGNLYEDNLFLANLYEFLAVKPMVLEPNHPEPVPDPLQKGIVFDNVSFSYPSSNRKVLEDISLSIAPGETVALVGRNGCGKTTLAKLLCRLYDPLSGAITLDGFDLKQFSVKDLRHSFSVLFQDFVKYHLTAKENIWFGNVDQPVVEDRVAAAAQQAGVDELISGLPKGYDTFLGKWFEDGEELSSGEWQKIALARSFFRKAQIILLDEPASSLDPRAEHEIFEEFKELVIGKTAVFISHRLSTVKMADRIFVMEKGRIIENGTYEELMQKKGSFAHLFETHD